MSKSALVFSLPPRLSRRSRITLRWSTAPADMGYGHKPAPKRLTGKPYIGSPRTVLAELARVMRNVGEGTYIRAEFAHRGRIVEKRELEDLLLT